MKKSHPIAQFQKNSHARQDIFSKLHYIYFLINTNVCPANCVHCSFHFPGILDPSDGLHDFCACLGSLSCYCDDCPSHRLHLPNLGFFHPPICLWKTRGKLSEADQSQLVSPNIESVCVESQYVLKVDGYRINNKWDIFYGPAKSPYLGQYICC